MSFNFSEELKSFLRGDSLEDPRDPILPTAPLIKSFCDPVEDMVSPYDSPCRHPEHHRDPDDSSDSEHESDGNPPKTPRLSNENDTDS